MDPRRHQIGFVAVSVARSLVLLVAALTITISLLAPSANASILGSSNAQRRALALKDAHHLLSLATLPSGSTRLLTWNRANGAALLSTSPVSGDPDQVDVTEYFLAPAGDAARQWLDARVPRGGTFSGSGSSSGPGTDDVTYLSFSFPTAASFLKDELQYSMLITAKGDLGLRVDADVTWTPRKSKYSIVAPGATKVVVIADRGLNVHHDTVSSTDRATINAFVTRVDELPASTPGVFHCPVDFGATLTVRFFRTGDHHPYAAVNAQSGGCGDVTVLQYNGAARLLGSTTVSGGTAFAAFVATTMHIAHWGGAAA